jgi:hypothetical protein
MQIFALHIDPHIAAKYHCDKHVLKMVVEYAQLMSTAHRVLDGTRKTLVKPNGKKQHLYLLDGERVVLNPAGKKYIISNPKLYNTTHVNHPCGVWLRESTANYYWLLGLLEECLLEYNRRYSKIHKIQKPVGRSQHSILQRLSDAPANLKHGELTEFAMAIPENYKVPNDPIASYKAFYIGDKARFAKWTNTDLPEWFINGVKDTHDISTFIRTR